VRIAVYVGRFFSALFDVHIQLAETVAAHTHTHHDRFTSLCVRLKGHTTRFSRGVDQAGTPGQM